MQNKNGDRNFCIIRKNKFELDMLLAHRRESRGECILNGYDNKN